MQTDNVFTVGQEVWLPTGEPGTVVKTAHRVWVKYVPAGTELTVVEHYAPDEVTAVTEENSVKVPYDEALAQVWASTQDFLNGLPTVDEHEAPHEQ